MCNMGTVSRHQLEKSCLRLVDKQRSSTWHSFSGGGVTFRPNKCFFFPGVHATVFVYVGDFNRAGDRVSG